MHLTKRVLVAVCGAHIIQDGLVALQFVLLPILAQTFGLNYTQVGVLRAISNGAMSALEVPAGILAERYGERRLLVFGLVGAGLGYIGVAMAPGFITIALFFLLTGIGAGFQHSLASSVVVKSFTDTDRRRALGTYNSSGDAGKLAFTGVFSIGVGAGLAWNAIVIGLAVIAIGFGAAVSRLLFNTDQTADSKQIEPAGASRLGQWGIINPRRFSVLAVLVFLDSTIQTVFLTFLAFVFLDKGVSEGVATGAVVIALAGGMVGKFGCGYLAAKLGDRRAFIVVQVLTVFGLVALDLLPAMLALALLPLIGLVVQGSSTITYGSVADFIEPTRQSRGYALIYTLATASSVSGALILGAIADYAGLSVSLWVLALLAVITVPLGGVLAGRISVGGAA